MLPKSLLEIKLDNVQTQLKIITGDTKVKALASSMTILWHCEWLYVLCMFRPGITLWDKRDFRVKF